MTVGQLKFAEAFIFGDKCRIVERLLELTEPIKHIVVVQISPLSANNALSILMVAQTSRNKLVDHQIFRTTHSDDHARLHFDIASTLNGKNIIRRISQQHIQTSSQCIFHKQHSLLSEGLTWVW